MTDRSVPREVLAFGRYRIDPNEHLLSFEQHPVPLEPKVFDTLVALVEARGRLVSKEELLQQVWPDAFVDEGSLARNISTIRKAFGGGAETDRYIETIPKRGYRFVAPVVPSPTGQWSSAGMVRFLSRSP